MDASVKRVSSALFGNLTAAEATPPGTSEQQNAETPEPIVRQPRVRKKTRQRAATLQIQCDAATWSAIRIEALKRRVSVSALLLRAVRAQYPGIVPANHQEAA